MPQVVFWFIVISIVYIFFCLLFNPRKKGFFQTLIGIVLVVLCFVVLGLATVVVGTAL